MDYKICTCSKSIFALMICFATFITLPKIKALNELHPFENDVKEFWVPDDNGKIVQVVIEDAEVSIMLDVNKIKFYLSTSQNPDMKLEFYGPSFDHYDFSPYVLPHAPTYFICHGFLSSSSSGPGPAIIPNLLRQNKSVNVFNIDWYEAQHYFEKFSYGRAVSSTRKVAEVAAKLIIRLVKLNLIGFSDVHFIGHSLGAHIGGFTGKNILPFGNISRITGLDPAGFKFEGNSPADRLDANDAYYVDVIHTGTSRPVTWFRLGYREPLGDVDFYPNGGAKQPGCSWDVAGTCSHSRSYDYLAESIKNEYHFHAWKCADWEQFKAHKCSENEKNRMGLNIPSWSKGTYYLHTNDKSPYAKVPYGLFGAQGVENLHTTAETIQIRELRQALNNFERIVTEKENILDSFRMGQFSNMPLEFYLQAVNNLDDPVLQTFALKELQFRRHNGSIPFSLYSACLIFNNEVFRGLQHDVPQSLATVFSNQVIIETEEDHQRLNLTRIGSGSAVHLVTMPFSMNGGITRPWQLRPVVSESNCLFTITNIEQDISIGIDSSDGTTVVFENWTANLARNRNFLWNLAWRTSRGNGRAFEIKSAQNDLALESYMNGTVYLQGNNEHPFLWHLIY